MTRRPFAKIAKLRRRAQAPIAPMFSDKHIRATASQLWRGTENIEVDANGHISRYPDLEGCYVQAWIWISDNDVRRYLNIGCDRHDRCEQGPCKLP